jgi:hypothetical protein
MPPVPVSQLQRLVLEALRAGRPLPGGSRPLTLPDAPAFLPAGPEIPVASETLEDPAALPAGFRAVAGPRERAYLRFRPAERVGDQVCLTLELQLDGLALSGTRSCFREDGTVADDPVQFAT